ncbi:hypothetical protein FH972_024098 [Carpinus fangiana]|uniref:Uncharacterized protein n=1 Tax=Carpinus fangiana TaxID=176857 RepID=A0A5N6KXE4_9ROSI|nr:hypothetical protein FH972_024098 [Carpinus fangiana]
MSLDPECAVSIMSAQLTRTPRGRACFSEQLGRAPSYCTSEAASRSLDGSRQIAHRPRTPGKRAPQLSTPLPETGSRKDPSTESKLRTQIGSSKRPETPHRCISLESWTFANMTQTSTEAGEGGGCDAVHAGVIYVQLEGGPSTRIGVHHPSPIDRLRPRGKSATLQRAGSWTA